MKAISPFLQNFAKVYPLLQDCERERALIESGSPETNRLENLLYKLREATVPLNHPFDPRRRHEVLFDQFAGSDASPITRYAAVSSGFDELYQNAVARLAQIAEQVEAAVSETITPPVPAG